MRTPRTPAVNRSSKKEKNRYRYNRHKRKEPSNRYTRGYCLLHFHSKWLSIMQHSLKLSRFRCQVAVKWCHDIFVHEIDFGLAAICPLNFHHFHVMCRALADQIFYSSTFMWRRTRTLGDVHHVQQQKRWRRQQRQYNHEWMPPVRIL